VGIKKTVSIEKKITLRLERKEPDFDTIRINEPIRLDNILYDYNKDDIRPDAEPDLQDLTDLMLQYPDMKIELSSHTDARGKDDYNMDLSQRRAESAKRWILAKGIKEDRIVAKGYGETKLLNECTNGVECSDEQHQLNRRTEFKILSGPTSIITEKVEKREKKPTQSSGKQAVNPLFFLLEAMETSDDILSSSNPADREIKFKDTLISYGIVREGAFVDATFVFDNIGTRALEIELVSGCECMNIQWPTEKILPGESGQIVIKFNTMSFNGDITKEIDVIFKNLDAKGYRLVKQVIMSGKIN
jgi:peptidoglycan-associated lipoprotein